MPIPTDSPDDGIPVPAPPDAFPALSHFRIPNIPPAAYYIPDFISPEEEDYLLRKLGESPQPKWKTVASGRRLQYWGGTLSKNGTLLPEPLPDFLTAFPNTTERIDSFLDVASGDEFNGSGKVLGINQVLVNEYAPGQGISPHEDGPAFRPLVATLSLGSHCILDLHHYLSTASPSPPMIPSDPPPTLPNESHGGRPIAAIPLAHLLLLPRSLLILSSSLYASHLHGISARTEDVVIRRNHAQDHSNGDGVQIVNTDLLGDASVIDALRDNGQWTGIRETRTSLTFRHVEKVLKGGIFAMNHGALKRT